MRIPALVLVAAMIVGMVFQAKPVAAAACPSSGDFVTISVSCNFPAGSYTFTGDLTIAAGVTVTMNGDTTGDSGVTITADNIIVLGTISADYQGYGYRAGPGAAYGNSGAGHGGVGGQANADTPGGVYDSVTQPTNLGSGGYYSCGNISGGGAVKLVTSSTGTLLLGGSISANGATPSGCGSPAPSGGAVWISTGTFTGGGTISANGGNGACCNYGGGGGGRVAIYYSTDSSTGTVTAYGGTGSGAQAAGAGTIYKKASGASNGDLIIDNGNNTNNAYTTQSSSPSASQTYDNVTVRNGADYRIPTGKTLTVNSGGNLTGGGTQRPSVTVDSGGTFNPPNSTQTLTNLDVSNAGTVGVVTNLTLSGSNFTHSGNFSAGLSTLSMNSTSSFLQNDGTGFNVTDLSYGSSSTFILGGTGSFNLNSLTLQDTGTFEQRRTQTANITTVTVNNGGNITHTANSNSKAYAVDIYAHDINIQVGGTVNANYRGFVYNQGTGLGTLDSGSSYGGSGGQSWNGAPGAVYGSVSQPNDIGSGGLYNCGSSGGGAIKLVTASTGTIAIGGTISANGQNPFSCGSPGPTGGSVWLDTGTLVGGGAISAIGGGNVSGGNYGGGGGGRVALYYVTNSATGAVTAYGGTHTGSGQDGGAGTIFMKSSVATNGDLIVDDNNLTYNGYTTQYSLPSSSQTYDNVTIRNGADYRIPTGKTLTIPSIANLTTSGSQRPSLTVDPGGTFVPNSSSVAFNTFDVTNNGAISNISSLTLTSSTYTHNGSLSAGLTALTVGNSGNFVASTSSTLSSPTVVVQNGGTFTQNTTQTMPMGSLTVQNGGTVTHTANSNSRSYIVDISSSGDINIQVGGSINTNYRGYIYGQGSGLGTLDSGTGYGGNGGQGWNGAPGATYGSVTQPTDLGSGGMYNCGSTGGGAIKLVTASTGTIAVGGAISANGQNPSSCGSSGPAGGSIWLNTGTLVGGGAISANGGGNTSGGNYGAGGGGRIAIYYVTNSATGSVSAYGGTHTGSAQDGGAGTIYMKSSGATNGDLIVDNNNLTYNGYTTQYSLPSSSQTYDNVTIKNGADYRVPTGKTLTIPSFSNLIVSGAQRPSLTIDSGGTFTPNSSSIAPSNLDIVNNGTLNSVSSLTLSSSTFTYGGSFPAGLSTLVIGSSSNFVVSTANSMSSASVTVQNGGTFTQNTTTSIGLASLTVQSGGLVTHTYNSSSRSYVVDINASGNINIQLGGSVNVDSRGFTNNQGTGKANGNSGAGYGGSGGQGSNGTPGGTYGSYTQPTDLGSGGTYCSNVNGGGAIKLTAAGTLTAAGPISAKGTDAPNPCGGPGASGGSIWLSVGSLAGGGTVQVTGGAGYGAGYGGGGGGRIAVYYSASTFSGTTTAPGGAGSAAGSSGSVYWHQNAPTVSSVTHSPPSPFVTDAVTLSGAASYTNLISSIEIYLDGASPSNLVGACSFSPAVSSASCTAVASLLSRGSHTTTVKAYGSDSSTGTGTEVFTVGGSTSSGQLQVSRLKTGATGSFALSYTLSGTSSQNLVVTFPSGFTVNSAFTSGSGCLSNFGYTALTLTANVTDCNGTVTASGASITNPLTPGTYTVTWTDDNGSGSIIVVTDDQIGVTGNVDPSLTFNVGSQASATACAGTFSGNGGTLSLGTLSSSFVTTSDATSTPHICTRVSTNAASGVSVSVKSANSALTSVLTPADSIPSSTATLAPGVSGYGLCAGSSGSDYGTDSTVPVGALPVSSSPFNSTCTTSAHNVGGLTSSFQSVWSLPYASQNAFARLYVKAAISATVPAHNDYADTLTFIATGTY